MKALVLKLRRLIVKIISYLYMYFGPGASVRRIEYKFAKAEGRFLVPDREFWNVMERVAGLRHKERCCKAKYNGHPFVYRQGHSIFHQFCSVCGFHRVVTDYKAFINVEGGKLVGFISGVPYIKREADSEPMLIESLKAALHELAPHTSRPVNHEDIQGGYRAVEFKFEVGDGLGG